ncbi:hypothetical protein [Streptomyces chartreusis]
MDIWYPYYGDQLKLALTSHESADVTAAPVFASATPTAQAVYEEIVAEAAEKSGLPHESQVAAEWLDLGAVGALQRQLSWLTARSDLDEWVIANIFRDVAVYLDDLQVRDAVLQCVLETVPDTGELVLVSHGLGTVVAMDLMTRLSPGVDLVHLTTAGSPLGLESVYSRLLIGGPKRPKVVTDWLNAWCPTDAVTIGCPLHDHWEFGATDIAVANARDRAHSIEEYLSHAEVARPIGSGLAG